MKPNLLEIFTEADGSFSFMRVAALLVIVFTLGPGAVASFRKGEAFVPTTEQVATVVSVLGLKAWQRGRETPAPPTA